MQSIRQSKLLSLITKFKPKIQKLGFQNRFIKIVEVGPRDGLQNQKKILSIDQKISLINRLSQTGLKSIEVGSFVSPKWIPQMANSKQLYQKINKLKEVSYPCLVPNQKGFQQALSCKVQQIAIFGSATQGFSQKNINCSVKQSLEKYKTVTQLALKHNIKIRGYVSMVMGCPYDGDVMPQKVKYVVQKLFQLGCYQVSLGDTIGKGTPQKTRNLLLQLSQFPKQKIAVHFHDTFDSALQNILQAIALGYTIIDSSIGGLGGCPYSMKPVGNVCTENVVYTLHQLGLKTGIDYAKLSQIGDSISKVLERPNLRIF